MLILSMANPIKKRDFLKLLVLSVVPGTVDRAQAISILDDLKKNAPNSFERELIDKPQKQILLAEKMSCPLGGILKSKCVAIN